MRCFPVSYSFFSSARGAVVPTFAVILPVLLLLMGLLVDTGRLYAVRNKAQNAADAALLGASASQSTVEYEAEFNKIFYANYPAGYMGSTVRNLQVHRNPDTQALSVDMDVRVPAIVMGMVSRLADPQHPQGVIGETTIHIGAGASGLGPGTPFTEVAMALDNSGSMAQAATAGSGTTKMDALKTAASSMVDILFDGADPERLHVSLVPYDMVVNIGPGRAHWLSNTPSGPPTFAPGDFPWTPVNEKEQYFLPTTRTPRDTYSAIVAAKTARGLANVGYAAGRQNLLCGGYFNVVHAPALPAGSKTVCVTTTCTGTERRCTNNVETGVQTCQDVAIGCTCTQTETHSTPATPDNYYGAWHWGICYDNAKDDVSDTPPGVIDATLFTLPYETAYVGYNAGAGKWIASNATTIGNYTTANPTDVLPTFPGLNWTATWSYAGPQVPPIDYRTWPDGLSNTPIVFASNDLSVLHSTISNMAPAGVTRVNIGLMWGWFTLSPNWKGVWDPAKPNFPGDPADQGTVKYLILMTDGKNTVDATGDNEKTRRLCSRIKGQGIHVYTVGFGQNGEIDQDLLRSCANVPQDYFYAPDEETLNSAFRQIADQINAERLRLVQ